MAQRKNLHTPLLILLGVFCTCVSFAQKPDIKQGPVAKGLKVSDQTIFIGEDETCYYFYGCSYKNTILAFDKSDLSLKVEKDFKAKKAIGFPLCGCVFGDTIVVITARFDSKGYLIEKSTITKTDVSLVSNEEIGFSPFEDGKKHVVNMDPVNLSEQITVFTKPSPDQHYRALVRIDQCENGAPSTWNVMMLDNRTGTTLWSRETDFYCMDFVPTNDGRIILAGYYHANSGDEALAALSVISSDEEERMSFPLPVNIGSAELLLNGNRLWVTGSLRGENYGKWIFPFNKNAALSGMYVTVFDLYENAIVTSDEYPFTKADVDVFTNVKEDKSKDNLVHWISFHPYLMNDGRVCVKGEYDFKESISTNTGVYYWFGKKGCILNMFDTDGDLQWRKPVRNRIVGPKETIVDDLFDMDGNLCYYSMVCANYTYSQTDVAASQDPKILRTKLREIILDQDGNETVNVTDCNGQVGMTAQSYNAAMTKRVCLLIEQGVFKSDVRLTVFESLKDVE